MRICVMRNKPAMWISKLLREVPGVEECYAGVVFDRDCQSLRIREHADGRLYMSGYEMKDCTDCHELSPDVPEGRYVYSPTHCRDVDLGAYDEVVIVVEQGDFEAYLAIEYRLRSLGADMERMRCLELKTGCPGDWEADVMGAVTGMRGLSPFMERYGFWLGKRREEGFASNNPMTRNFFYLQEEAQMGNKEFAEYFGTNVRNVENWRRDPGSLAGYIYDLFEYKLLKEGII